MSEQPSPKRYGSMVYRRCGRSGLLLPAVSLGLWHNFGETSPIEPAKRMIFRAFDLGITHFDLANNYGPPPGSAEENFGKILACDLSAYRDEQLLRCCPITVSREAPAYANLLRQPPTPRLRRSRGFEQVGEV